MVMAAAIWHNGGVNRDDETNSVAKTSAKTEGVSAWRGDVMTTKNIKRENNKLAAAAANA